ncbi:hypothetical protein BGZ94_008545 [Podila epigama]|nr:hypothetical protein BGZ94_008545 [Podila epigama]
MIPYPAASISPAKLATLIEGAEMASSQHHITSSSSSHNNNNHNACAGPRRSQHRPLILDLRPQSDFSPLSIQHSININMPTLLVRRYRRGVAVASCSIESFITMPSDKEFFHSLQESWRTSGSEEPVDIIVLDQEMSSGTEEYGRSASAAWTLVSVLEQGAGQCLSNNNNNNTTNPTPQHIRVWYLEGGFEAFRTWDAGEKFLLNEGGDHSSMASSPSMSSPPLTPNFKEEEIPMRVSKKPSLSIDTASVTFTPKTPAGTGHKAPARRESLFSLNTKSLQRPAGLNRSQTVHSASAPNLKPLVIPSPNNTFIQQQSSQQLQQPHQQKNNCWLTVPNQTSAPALSPAMSMVSNHSMDLMNGPPSASTDNAFFPSSATSAWSADAHSINGSGHFNGLQLSLKSKRSFSSLNTNTTMSIREGGEESETDLSSVSPEGSHGQQHHHHHHSMMRNDFHLEYQSRMFSRNDASGQYDYYQQKQYYYQEDCSMEYDQSHDERDDDEEEDENKGEQEISCILPNFLYLGPEIVTQAQVEELEGLGVRRVLNMAQECEDKVLIQKAGQFEYHKIGVQDHIEADVSAGLLNAVEIIASSKDSPIYVHCKAGKSRSVTATIAYLMMHLHWPLNKAYQHVLTQRPCMCPNIGFVTELMSVEKKTFGAENAAGLHLQRI